MTAPHEWQPIATCPPHEIVLLWCPENSPWVATVWKGRRIGRGDDGFSIATPYEHQEDGYAKQVWCPIHRFKHWPTHWMPLPTPPASQPLPADSVGGEG